MENRKILTLSQKSKIKIQKLQGKRQKLELDKILALSAVILTAVFFRLVPHPPNFAPIGGLALFSGAYLSGKKSLIIPISAMLLSDIFLGFHSTMIFVYSSFALITFIGRYLHDNQKIKLLFSASLLSSILFFIITNFGSWLTMPFYPRNLIGLIEAYVMGIPFFRNTLVSDLTYTFSFFYGFQYMQVLLKKIKISIIANFFG